jgi:hypothetical protein
MSHFASCPRPKPWQSILYDPELHSWIRSERSERLSQARATPLTLCRLLWHARHRNAPERRALTGREHSGLRLGGNPVACIIAPGTFVEIARVLLKHGADTEAPDNRDYSPLERVAHEDMWNLFRSFWSMAQMRMRRTTKGVHRCIGHRIGDSQWLLRYFSVMAQMRQPSVRINRLLYIGRRKKRLLDFFSSMAQTQTPWTS